MAYTPKLTQQAEMLPLQCPKPRRWDGGACGSLAMVPAEQWQLVISSLTYWVVHGLPSWKVCEVAGCTRKSELMCTYLTETYSPGRCGILVAVATEFRWSRARECVGVPRHHPLTEAPLPCDNSTPLRAFGPVCCRRGRRAVAAAAERR